MNRIRKKSKLNPEDIDTDGTPTCHRWVQADQGRDPQQWVEHCPINIHPLSQSSRAQDMEDMVIESIGTLEGGGEAIHNFIINIKKKELYNRSQPLLSLLKKKLQALRK